MTSIRCPQCGKPAPIALSAPDEVRCDACGFRGAPEEEDRARLVAAAAELQRIDAAHRQLRGVGRRALESGTARVLIYLAFAGALLLPVVGVTAVLVSWSTPLMTVLVSVPALTMIAVFALGLTLLRRRLAHLEEACAAAPPRAPGEPARCHVCGAPLASGAAIVRCGFCAADNLVTPNAIARARAHHERRAAALGEAVTARAASVQQLSRGVGLALGMSVVSGPILMCLSAAPLIWIDELVELEVDDAERFVWVPAEGGRCVGRVIEGYDRILFGGPDESGAPHRLDGVTDLSGYAPLDPRALEGETMIGMPEQRVGRIDRVVGTLDARTRAILVDAQGEEHGYPLESLCVQ